MPSIDSQEGALSLSLAIVFATIAGILIFWIIFVYVYELATKPRKFAFLIICVIFSICKSTFSRFTLKYLSPFFLKKSVRIVHFISYICLNQPEDRIGTTTVFKTVGVCTFYLAFLLVLFIWTKAASPTKKIPFLPFLIGYILFFVVMMALLIAFEVLIFTHQALSPSSDYIIQDQQVIDSTDSSGDIYDAMLAISAFCSTIIALAFLVNTILIVRVTQNVSNWKFYRVCSFEILILEEVSTFLESFSKLQLLFLEVYMN